MIQVGITEKDFKDVKKIKQVNIEEDIKKIPHSYIEGSKNGILALYRTFNRRTGQKFENLLLFYDGTEIRKPEFSEILELDFFEGANVLEKEFKHNFGINIDKTIGEISSYASNILEENEEKSDYFLIL